MYSILNFSTITTFILLSGAIFYVCIDFAHYFTHSIMFFPIYVQGVLHEAIFLVIYPIEFYYHS